MDESDCLYAVHIGIRVYFAAMNGNLDRDMNSVRWLVLSLIFVVVDINDNHNFVLTILLDVLKRIGRNHIDTLLEGHEVEM